MSHLVTPQPLSKWLTPSNSPLGQYYHKAQQLSRLNDQWKQQKEIPLVLHSMIANFENKTVTIAVASNEWATHLHYAQRELCARLKTWPGLEALTTIKWYVQSPS